MRNPKEFYVGYLSAPEKIAGLYKLLIPILGIAALLLGVSLASKQQTPGATEAVFSNVEVTGYLTVDPYPVLHGVGEDNRSVLLVEQTKHSANGLAEPFANQWVSMSGFTLQRGDWHMLQLKAGAEITPVKQSRISVPLQEIGEVTLQGEIIDSKCFLGAMKPGGGKVHRACASLCLLGGIPPMLVTKDGAGNRFGYVLMNADGSSAAVDLSRLVAIPVELTGTLVKRGDLQYIKLAEDAVQKLSGVKLADYGDSVLEPAALAYQ